MKKAHSAFVSRIGSNSLAGTIAALLAGAGAAQTPDDAALEEITVTGTRNTIPSRAWTNLVLGFNGEIRERGSWRISLNVQNLFDKDPPIIAQSGDTRFGAQATDPLYDAFGRRYQLGFNTDF